MSPGACEVIDVVNVVNWNATNYATEAALLADLSLKRVGDMGARFAGHERSVVPEPIRWITPL